MSEQHDFPRTPEEAAANEKQIVNSIIANEQIVGDPRGGLAHLMQRIESRRLVATRQRDNDTPYIDDPGDRAEAVARLNAIIEEDEKGLARLASMIPGA